MTTFQKTSYTHIILQRVAALVLFFEAAIMYNVNSLIVTAVIIPLLGVVAVALRFYVRLRLTPTYVGVDDWAIALSCLLVCGIAADIIVGT